MSKVESVELLIPMHDAVLFQHQASFDTKLAIKIFEDEMTSALDSKITGKASIEPFFE